MQKEFLSNFSTEAADLFLDEMSTNGYGMLEITLDKILDEGSRASIQECDEALVACEVVAAVAGKPSHELPDDLAEWIGMFISPGSEARENVLNLKEKAADVIDRITSESELRDYWEDESLFGQWLDVQIDLQKRILEGTDY